jgi:beta-lactamase regulating signal transducer with metallopeptidase domain
METALLIVALKATAVLAVAICAAKLARRTSAAARHLLLSAAVAGALALPLLGSILPELPVTVRVPWLAAPTRASPSPLVPTSTSTPTSTTTPTRISTSMPAAAEPAPPPRASWGRLALLLWASAALALLARAGWGHAGLVRVARQAEPMLDAEWQRLLRELVAELRIGRRVALLRSSCAAVPLTWGILRPCIVLPSSADGWPDGQRRAVLLHELAHVERLDALTQLVARVACAVHWPNPLVWVAARGMRLERERACDDRVLAGGARPSDYARTLLDIARGVHHARGPQAALAMARRSHLEGRLLAVLDPSARRTALSRRGAVFAGAAAGVLVVPLAALEARESGAGALAAAPPSAAARVQSEHPLAGPTQAERPAPASRPLSARRRRSPTVAALQPQPPTPPTPPTTPTPPTAPTPPSAPRSISIQSSGSRWISSWTGDDGRSAQLEATGQVAVSPDLRGLSLSPGAAAQLTRREEGQTRMVMLRADEQGRIDRSWIVDGHERPWDASTDAWVASFIDDLDRRTAFALEQRFPTLMRAGGVDAALAHVDRCESPHARGMYLAKLVESAQLDSNRLVRALRATRTIDSDYARANVLAAIAAKHDLGDSAARVAFLESASGLRSDYELGRVLKALLAKGKLDAHQVRTVLTAATRMKSDYEKANVLIGLIGNKLLVAPVRAAYLETAATLRSDYEHGRVLKALAADAALDSDTLRAIAEQAAEMRSDYEAASVLIALAGHHQLTGAPRQAYERSAQRLRSQYERQRALAALPPPASKAK